MKRKEMTDSERLRRFAVVCTNSKDHDACLRGAAAIEAQERLSGVLAEMVKQKVEPWEYYGVDDDQRCAFCGRTRWADAPDDEDAHDAGCAWQMARAALTPSQEANR